MQRPDPMISSSYGATDVEAQKARVLWLEELFFLMDGTKCHTLNMACSQVWP